MDRNNKQKLTAFIQAADAVGTFDPLRQGIEDTKNKLLNKAFKKKEINNQSSSNEINNSMDMSIDGKGDSNKSLKNMLMPNVKLTSSGFLPSGVNVNKQFGNRFNNGFYAGGNIDQAFSGNRNVQLEGGFNKGNFNARADLKGFNISKGFGDKTEDGFYADANLGKQYGGDLNYSVTGGIRKGPFNLEAFGGNRDYGASANVNLMNF
tara:strand:- start:51 stop:671 length:621 start_codon:yes stop_codon:yes gene_type:complete